MRTTPLLAALLMLGGVSCAYAQEGPPEGSMGASERGSSATQERGSGPDAGVSNRSEAGEKSSGASGKNADSPKGQSAEKSGQSKDKSTSGRDANETGEKSSKSTAKSDSDEPGGPKRDGSDTTDKSATTKETSPADKTDRSATDTSKGTTTDRAAETKPSADKAKQVELTGDKRTKVQSAFRDAGSNVKHRTNVDIDISVGRRLPRDWDFVPVPSAVIAIVPEYRDYYFAYVEDEYVIVEPDTYEVVAVLPAEPSRAGVSSSRQGGGQCSTQLSLSTKERELVIDNVKGGREADIAGISVGRDVPKGIELQRFPDSVLAEAKALEGCQYFDAGDQIAIVDPNEDKIVLLIDKS
jgi:Protein of unknown function (DUF1236)